jgi:hypothetical protein
MKTETGENAETAEKTGIWDWDSGFARYENRTAENAEHAEKTGDLGLGIRDSRTTKI